MNGQGLAVRKTGFPPFGFDLTPHVRIGATNVPPAMVDNGFLKVEWAALHRAELMENWQRARQGQPLAGIAPSE